MINRPTKQIQFWLSRGYGYVIYPWKHKNRGVLVVKEALIKVFGVPSRFYYGWLVRLSLNILKNLDANMIKAHYPPYKRRQF